VLKGQLKISAISIKSTFRREREKQADCVRVQREVTENLLFLLTVRRGLVAGSGNVDIESQSLKITYYVIRHGNSCVFCDPACIEMK